MTSEVSLNKLKIGKSVVEVRGHLGTFESRKRTKTGKVGAVRRTNIQQSERERRCWGNFSQRVETALLWVWIKERSGSYTSENDT